jgi:nucleoside-diphosphate-sugar epimerase
MYEFSKAKILITGATGFVGIELCRKAAQAGLKIRRALRHAADEHDVSVGDIGLYTDWNPALKGIRSVIHLAARVHVMKDKAEEPLADFRHVNTEGTLNLARQAADAGVKRMIFVSSIKVNGEFTQYDKPFTAFDIPKPNDAYAISKFEAEQGLREIEKTTELEVVIIRPPLIYGPGVKANFLRLMQAVYKGLPLPLGLVKNKRSLVALDNLIDLILLCVNHPNAGGQTFLVSDDEDLSTPELIMKLGNAMGKKQRLLLPLPPVLLSLGGIMTGKKAEMDRLIDSLQVDINHTREVLGWRPRLTVDQGISEAVMGSVLGTKMK